MLECWNKWTVGIDGASLRKEVVGDLVARDPNVVLASEVDLVDGSMFVGPFCELHPAALFRKLVHIANKW